MQAFSQGERRLTSEPPPAADDVLGIALKVARAIEAVGGQYFVGGSLASSLQGEPRATNDIDFVIAMPIGRLQAFRDALGADFEVDLDSLRDAVLHARTSNAFFLPSVTKIDFFGRSYEAYDEAEFSRRYQHQVRQSGETLFLKTAEDTVLRKLLWYREGGCVSDRQWRDICSVLRISGNAMDDAYLARWADHLGLAALLAKARAE